MADTVKRDWRKRKPTHTREVRAEHLPPGVRQAMLEMADRITQLEAALVEQSQTISRLTTDLIETKKELSTFRKNVNAAGAHFAGVAA